MRTISTTPTTTSLAPTSLTSADQRSSWHSPVPYLFGGLAAMLGLIAFALLILACSYWKLAGQLQNEDRDLESQKEGDSAKRNL
ncbi:protein GLUTAMINE DUMPER 2-like [Sesbania bispinosa]|nr:protein GLUTAMINE DUMPER 2-like [Sesbania bispinosa]